MPDRPSQGSGLLMAIAALIAALALFIGALRYAGLIGPQPVVIAPTAEPTAPIADREGPASDITGTKLYPVATVAGGLPSSTPAGQIRTDPGPTERPTDTSAVVVEDWQEYSGDEDLGDAFSTNTAVPDNSITLTLTTVQPVGAPSRMPAVAISYTIVVTEPNDYVGFQRDLAAEQNWSGKRALVLWVETSDRSDRQLVVQWHEVSDEVWRHRVRLGDIGPGLVPVTIPLSPEAWEWADWSARQNGQLDLARVNHFGIFVGHAGLGSGAVRVGRIEVVP